MSEHQPNLEKHETTENLHIDHEHQARLEKDLKQQAERAKQRHEAQNLEHLLEKAEAAAGSSKDIVVEHQEDQEPDDLLGLQQSLKTSAYQHTLLRIQQRLPKQAKLFSKVAHNKTVEAISNSSAQTVVRPSGLLGGSLCAFIGNLALLYYAKHYGFNYNYALFIVLFVGGFMIGVIAELAIWLLFKRRQTRNSEL